MAKKCFQKEGVGYSETFAPVVLFKIFLFLFGTFVSKGWHVQHANISTAFLNDDIGGELYVSLDNAHYNLKKSLYGLKRSSRL